jgi:hypothetical protein
MSIHARDHLSPGRPLDRERRSVEVWLAAAFGAAVGPGRRWRGTVAMLALAGGYTLAVSLLAQQGATPVPSPFLRIPDETYYWWSMVFIGPVLLAGWLLAAAMVQLWGRTVGGIGAFEDLASVLGLVIAGASLATLLPDLVMGTLGIYGGTWTTTWYGRGLILGWLSLYLTLFLIGFPAATRVVHRLPTRQAALIGGCGFVVYQGFIFLFIR